MLYFLLLDVLNYNIRVVHQDAIQYHKYVSAAVEGRQQYKSALLERLSTFSSTTSRSCALYIKTTFI
uniref:Uncharacterized protein n=1 Tax=Trichogramma kaykai TaxID=54128 RepID=A0ABD2W554_9HYME